MLEQVVLDVELKVNGVTLKLAPFVQDMMGGAILGMVSKLRGAEGAREIEVSVRRVR